MTVKDRVKAFCKSENITVSAFEASIGVANGYVNAISKSIGLDKIKIILEKYPNLNIEWLLVGYGDMHKPLTVPTLPTKPTISTTPNIGTPYYDVDFIGGFDFICNDQTTVPALNIVAGICPRAQFWCNITGHSMEPTISNGDIIALRQCSIEDIQYGEIYAVVLDELRTVKIIRRSSTPGMLRFVPVNTDNYDEQEFPIQRIQHIYEVQGCIRRFF